MRKLLLAAMVAAALAVPYMARGATYSSGVGAGVVTPISITNVAALNFGDIASGATTGTVVINTFGVRTATGGVTLPRLAGVTPSRAIFTVTGDAFAAYSITLPSGSVTLTSGGNSVIIDTFTSDPGVTSTVGSDGESALSVGAKLHVGIHQPNGLYHGAFDVTVNYN